MRIKFEKSNFILNFAAKGERLMYKERSREEIIDAFKHAIGANQAFKDLVQGRITKQEFEARGYKLAKVLG